MMDEEFLNRREIRWYKRILIGAVIIALIFIVGVLVKAVA